MILKPAPEDVLDLYFGSLEAVGIDLHEARRPPRRGRLGGPDARRVGARLGGLVRRDGGHAVHVLPAARRARPRPRPGGDHLRARAAGHVPPGQVARRSTSSGRPASPGATSTARASASGRPTTSRRRRSTSLMRRFDGARGGVPRAASSTDLPLPAYDQVLKCLAHVQPARRARRDLGDRARRLHRPRPQPRARASPQLDRGSRWRRCCLRSAARSCPRRPAARPAQLPELRERARRRAGARSTSGRGGLPCSPRRRARGDARTSGSRARRENLREQGGAPASPSGTASSVDELEQRDGFLGV